MKKSIVRKWASLILTLTMVCSCVPAGAIEAPPEGSAAENILNNCEYTLDLGEWSTAVADGGAGHHHKYNTK